MSKMQVTYMTQVVHVYGIIAVSLSQLIVKSSDRELWLILLLSTCIGYVLPSPRLKFLKPGMCLTPVAATATTIRTTSMSSLLPSPLSAVNIEETGGNNGSDSDLGTDLRQ